MLLENKNAVIYGAGIRVICLRPDGIPETDTIGVVYGLHAWGPG